ncbi:hypothetical protein AU378_20075 [Chryseobacterium kwangjuense]|uniref:Uncharacterized protein n=1 Tax=Chryseobacterium kwangjuense TaxID=267125 RepID=A0A135W4R4_9FLAO|nr:hypothetical protein AU378_20075 [Chryseobacterium kwangjuense]
MSWGQQTIEGLTEEKFNAAQKLSAEQLLSKNITDASWCEIFLTLNSSINNQSKNSEYLKALTGQITNKAITSIEGTSKLIIWERITSGEILFEGKGLVVENDLFSVAGRANQLLQNMTKKNFGYVTSSSTDDDLKIIQNKWVKFISNQPVDEYRPAEFKGSAIPEASSLKAIEALIISIQNNPKKDALTKKCLQKIYKLDEMPKEKGPALYCSPDTHSYAYLSMLLGDKKRDETKDALWWKKFWDENHGKLAWDNEKGFYIVAK